MVKALSETLMDTLMLALGVVPYVFVCICAPFACQEVFVYHLVKHLFVARRDHAKPSWSHLGSARNHSPSCCFAAKMVGIQR